MAHFDPEALGGFMSALESLSPRKKIAAGAALSALGVFFVLWAWLSYGAIHFLAIGLYGIGMAAAGSGWHDLKTQARMRVDLEILMTEGESLAQEVARRRLRGREAIALLEERGLTQVRSRSLVLARAKEIREGG